MIICIGREFGSGWHEIGWKLAESLQVPFYDQKLVEAAMERGGQISEVLKSADEKNANALMHSVWFKKIEKGNDKMLCSKSKIRITQFK